VEFFVVAKLYCPHALAYGNWHIWITEKMFELSSVVLLALLSYVQL